MRNVPTQHVPTMPSVSFIGGTPAGGTVAHPQPMFAMPVMGHRVYLPQLASSMGRPGEKM